MIYALYLNGIGQEINDAYWGVDAAVKFAGKKPYALMGEYIRKHPEHKFLVIHTPEQKALFEQFIKEGKLADCVTPLNNGEGITNMNYPDKPRRLFVNIFQGKGE